MKELKLKDNWLVQVDLNENGFAAMHRIMKLSVTNAHQDLLLDGIQTALLGTIEAVSWSSLNVQLESNLVTDLEAIG